MSTGHPENASVSEFDVPALRRDGDTAALSSVELDRLGVVFAELCRCVTGCLASLPSVEIASDAALGRYLSLDRVTSHRIARLARADSDLRTRLRRAPGIRALQTFAQACEKKGVPRAMVGKLREATGSYESVVVELGRTQTALLRRLGVSAAPHAQDTDQKREVLFNAASAMFDQQIGCRADIHIFRPSERVKGMIDHTHARHIRGYQAGPMARALHVGLFGRVERGQKDHAAEFRSVEGTGLNSDSGIVAEFSSFPLPLVATRGEGERVRHVVNAGATDRPLDICVAHTTIGAGIDPKRESPPRLECGSMIREPTRSLVFDVWIDRDYADAHVPDLGIYQWSPTLAMGISDHWLDRLPIAPNVQRLASPAAAASPMSQLHSEFTWTLFRKIGWDPERFIGYRCETLFPIYGSAYYFAFDFGDRV